LLPWGKCWEYRVALVYDQALRPVDASGWLDFEILLILYCAPSRRFLFSHTSITHALMQAKMGDHANATGV